MSKHDNRVKALAHEYKRKGYKVEADIPGFETPDGIGKGGYIPDLLVQRGSRTKIIEVETARSINTDKEQQSAFRRSAAQRSNASFEIDQI